MMMMTMMMIMMIWFCCMVDRRKAFSFISSEDHCQRSSPSWISDTPRAGFEPALNLISGFVEWSCAVVIPVEISEKVFLFISAEWNTTFVLTKKMYFNWINYAKSFYQRKYHNQHFNITYPGGMTTKYTCIQINSRSCYFWKIVQKGSSYLPK